MKIIIAPDSFKESLTALEAASAIEAGFKRIFPNAEYIKLPMADGGEGTVQSLVDATGGKLVECDVVAPLGNTVQSFFGLSGDGKTAIIEMAAASGLHLVAPEQRNPLYTTSYGTGELIKRALALGVQQIILGIGGSATNDGGVGMLQALGIRFLNFQQQEIGYGGAQLAQLAQIDMNALDPRLAQVHIEVACDVNNPLCGERGASAIFGPQKGATPEMVAQLDVALAHFAEIAQRDCGKNIKDQPGAGAAGGMGGGLLLLPNVELKAGVQIVLENLQLADKVRDADLVITGEGRMDAQSILGKTPIGVARTAKQFNKPVIAIVGCLREDYEVVYEHGIDVVFPIIRQLAPLSEILQQGRENLVSAAQNIARLFALQGTI
ncbi:glycerate kinase [Aggregatibacter actinomycetemcomitans]|uniref:glycerate kinase n=1 Tax=Aggregatibacter actinomycetemcomitans TaxID=714 RepID=UPI00022AB92F|nr:glycerate kinase [Aggregatibacter actinomycetemcomitans]KYK97009.1 glycerate kinase [Aggregatibacter actinomycetemcomitans serotype d str. SA3733]ANU81779.1 glycerate kinase [Aggregatibacter actinomycetemcomitans]KOE68722.1 glycerate kinase [Aggregatibacter actinomycetemcomitans serotype d str. I63B]KYK83663.1 glycerate kinase [Aggregatibacter actinomycetemcomitans serotype d str. SA3033]KYK86372.1 glycerate kinase [Aggregatibacter actinomycetemcomitans serotype d str. SA2200]